MEIMSISDHYIKENKVEFCDEHWVECGNWLVEEGFSREVVMNKELNV